MVYRIYCNIIGLNNLNNLRNLKRLQNITIQKKKTALLLLHWTDAILLNVKIFYYTSLLQINHIDISPNYSGTMMSISNFVSNLVGSCSPLVAAYFLTDVVCYFGIFLLYEKQITKEFTIIFLILYYRTETWYNKYKIYDNIFVFTLKEYLIKHLNIQWQRKERIFLHTSRIRNWNL